MSALALLRRTIAAERGRRILGGIFLAALVGTSTSCTARYARYDFEDEWYDDKVERGWLPDELGLITPNLPMGPSGLALSLEGSSRDLDPRAVPPIYDWDDVKLRSVSVGGRFFPIDSGPFRPYAGGGYGRTTLAGRWTGPNYDPAPGIQCTGDCTDQFTEILYRGYSPFVMGGVEIGGSASVIVVEWRRELDRGDGFYRLSGDRISAGFRWRTYSGR